MIDWISDLFFRLIAFFTDQVFPTLAYLFAEYGFALVLWLEIAVVGFFVLSIFLDGADTKAHGATESYFDGTVEQWIGYRLLGWFITAVTLTICRPWATCMLLGYEADHTVVSGRRLRFEGTGGQLLGKRIVWWLLTLVTFGIFGLWVGVKQIQWESRNLCFDDGSVRVSRPESSFQKGMLSYWGHCIVAGLLTIVTLGLARPVAEVYLARWRFENTVVNGHTLRFDGKGGKLFLKYLLWAFLCVITLGVYGFFVHVEYLKWERALLTTDPLPEAQRPKPGRLPTEAEKRVARGKKARRAIIVSACVLAFNVIVLTGPSIGKGCRENTMSETYGAADSFSQPMSEAESAFLAAPSQPPSSLLAALPNGFFWRDAGGTFHLYTSPDGGLAVDAPADWDGMTSVAAGEDYAVGLRGDGTVAVYGQSHSGYEEIASWDGVLFIAAADTQTGAVMRDGTARVVGNNTFGQCDVAAYHGVTELAVSRLYTLLLLEDGSVVCVGDTIQGFEDIALWQYVRRISASGTHAVGLRADGTVYAAGGNDFGQCDVGAWTDVVDVAAVEDGTFGLLSDGHVVYVGRAFEHLARLSEWCDIVSLRAYDGLVLGLTADGSLWLIDYNSFLSGDPRFWVDEWPAQTEAAADAPSAPAPETTDLEAMILEGQSRCYTYEELALCSQYELTMLRNGMFALCGKRFSKNQQVIDYFNGCSWYVPRYAADQDVVPLMNEFEKANLDLIIKVELEFGYRDP